MNLEHFLLKFNSCNSTPEHKNIVQTVSSMIKEGLTDNIQVTKEQLQYFLNVTGLTPNKTWSSHWIAIFGKDGNRVDITYTSEP